jgi:diguanylate cyclase (GGDEF)-like protein
MPGSGRWGRESFRLVMVSRCSAPGGWPGRVPSVPSEGADNADVTFPTDRSGRSVPAGRSSRLAWSVGTANSRTRPWHLTVVGGVFAGLAVTAIGSRLSDAAGATLGMAGAGLSSLVSGITITWSAWRRRGAPAEDSRALIGAACISWGFGQVLLTHDATLRGRSFGLGDVFGSLAVPLIVAAVIRMPRRSRTSRPGQRLVLDALLLSLSLLMGVWWGILRPALPEPGQVSGTGLVSALMAFFDLFTAALTLLLWLRDRRPGAAPFALGAALQAVADIHALPTAIDGRLFPWTSGALWCLAWPLIALGAVRLRLTPAADEPEAVLEDLGESRSTSAVTIVGICAVAGLLVVPGDHPSTDVAAVVLGSVVVLLVGRELLANRIRNRLVTQLGQEALRDSLTGLPNRRALTMRIRSLDLGRPWVVLSVDLDGFKEINELRGHDAGDELLRSLAEALAGHCPAEGTIARMGGDEFAVLAPGTVADGERLGAELSRAVRTCPAGLHAGLTVTASVGIGRVLPENPAAGGTAGVPSVGRAGEGLPALLDPRHDRLVALIESTTALRAAKDLGRDRIAVYPGAVEQARERRVALEWRLREAIAAGRLRMHAQPLVDLRTGEVRGLESLARWTDELLGPVSPAEFVPIAEQAGLVTGLGDFALRATLEAARSGGLFGGGVEIGVNVSPIQLRLPQFARRVIDLVDELGLPPRQLVLEVTEAILIDEDDLAAGALAQLSAAGIRLAIDDFGTGYSALGYLRRLPVDVLKIDRSWVVDAWAERRTRSIVCGVIELAHQLGATVVMEGVEDADVAAMCLELGADLGQGWHFGRPVPWADAIRALGAASSNS